MYTSSFKDSENDILQIPNCVQSISKLLFKIVQLNENEDSNESDPFYCKNVPNISIEYYIQRIRKYTAIENSTLILSLIYADRICALNGLLLQPTNIHRIILSCVVLAIKFNEDAIYNNDYFAQIGGVSLKEMNYLEYHCLKMMNYNLVVDDEIFKKYVNYLMNYNK